MLAEKRRRKPFVKADRERILKGRRVYAAGRWIAHGDGPAATLGKCY